MTLTPEFKYTEILINCLQSSNISDGKYVSLGEGYTTTFAPVTLTASVTPSTIFQQPQQPSLNELSQSGSCASIVPCKDNESDLLGSKPFTLYTEAAYADSMISAKAAVKWADVTEFATYTYIQLSGSVNVLPPLTVAADYRLEPAKSGYNARLTYVMTPNVKLTGFYGLMRLLAITQ